MKNGGKRKEGGREERKREERQGSRGVNENSHCCGLRMRV